MSTCDLKLSAATRPRNSPLSAREKGDRARISSRCHCNRREVHKPALGLHEALDLRAHGARRHVVGDIKKCRVVDGSRMQLGERLVARLRVEGLARLRYQ